MDLLFRVLGWVAQISQKMSRLRVNFIPSNWLLIAACLFFAFASLRSFSFFALPFCLVLWGVGATFGFVALQNNAVFRPQRGGQFPSQNGVLELRATGMWTLGSVRRRFVEIPANFDLQSDGSRAFVCHINASSSLFLWQIENLDGDWKIVIPAGQTPDMTPSALYVSSTPRAALRLNWMENGRPQLAILSFSDGQARAKFLALWKSVN